MVEEIMRWIRGIRHRMLVVVVRVRGEEEVKHHLGRRLMGSLDGVELREDRS